MVTDWTCPRKRYLAYEYDGRGLSSSSLAIELFLGTAIHDGLAAIAHLSLRDAGLVDIDSIASAAQRQVFSGLMDAAGGDDDSSHHALEQAAMVEGILRGFHKWVWPQLMRTYPTIIAIEQEMTFVHGGQTFMAKPDLVLSDAEGNWTYLEYKSTSSKKPEWINSWGTAVQIHSTCKAIESTLGQAPVATIVQGLYKGYVAYGKQNSPFCYAYRRQGSPPFSKEEISYEYRAGFKKSPAWDLPGGVKAWVEGMPDEVLADLFPQTPPIYIRPELVEAFFAQREVRENEIDLALQLMQTAEEGGKEALLNTAFPQRFDQCQPPWGHPCGFRQICHGQVNDPLKQGWTYREPHHSTEQEAWERLENVSPTPTLGDPNA